MTISLDELAELAKAATGNGKSSKWWRAEAFHIPPPSDAAFIAACDPGTVLKLIAVVKAAHASEYAVTIEQCMEADCMLRKALSALEAT